MPKVDRGYQKKDIENVKYINNLGPKEERMFNALYEDDIDTIRFLLDEGVNINVKNTTYETPLHVTQNEEIVRMLIAKGADVNAVDDYRMSPIFNKDIILAKILVESGADIHAKSNKGNTLLMWYSYSGYIDGVRYLVGLGADANIKNIDGQTAYDIADTFGRRELIKYLKLIGAKPGKEIE